MKVFNLPGDRFSNKNALKSDIIIYQYSSVKDSFKEKAVLHRNAISLVISGQKTMHFAEKTVYTNNQEIHILSAGNCIASVDISKGTLYESILIFFNDNVLSDFYATNADLIEKARNKFKIRPSAYISFKKDEFIKNYIHSLQITLNKKSELSEQMKRLKLQELLLYLLETYTETFLSFKYSKNISQNELMIKKVVELNRLTNLTLEELAFLCNVSASTFKRQFKKIYNASPSTWFNEQKMKMAKQMLRDQKEKPGEIWFKLGFETHTGFTKSFKKYYGRLPKEYAGKMTLQE